MTRKQAVLDAIKILSKKKEKAGQKRSSFIGPYFIPGTALIIMKMQMS